MAGGAVVPWAPVTWNTFKRRRTRRRTRKLLQSWSGSRRRESGPEAEGRQSVEECARNRFICSATLLVRNAYIAGNRSPAVQAPPNIWFACTSVHGPPYAACGCKWGVGPCARCRGRGAPELSNARRPTRFARPVPAHRARPGPRSPSRAAISPSSEGLSGSHHADKTNFCGCGSPQDSLRGWQGDF